MEIICALDQNSNTPFLRNEFLKIFEHLFMMKLFTEMTHIYDKMKNIKFKLNTGILRLCDLKFVARKMFLRKLLKLWNS